LAGVLPRTPLGELTALPRPPSWLQGPTSKGRGGKGTGKEGGEGWEEVGRDRERGNGKEGVGMLGKREGRGGE